ncbi:GL14566 [Drosophila persimilis]|uniref:GL14566 n=1 Tax=Drosophila persimilis TaxID=7234 RepID=B4GW01_DROPE|nr:GL14566 [Drosophila persimilis]
MDSLQKQNTATVQASRTAQQQTATVKRNIEHQPLPKWPLPIAICIRRQWLCSHSRALLPQAATIAGYTRCSVQASCCGIANKEMQNQQPVSTGSCAGKAWEEEANI